MPSEVRSTPPKATWMRMLLCELNRIHSHLVFLGTSALELGAISMFWYCFRERELILDLYEMVTGQRMHTRYFQIGGLAEDIPEGFYAQCHEFVEWMPKAINDYLTLLDRNKTLSMPISPYSLTTTAVLAPSGLSSSARMSVVFPEPRKPVTAMTGSRGPRGRL